MAYSRGMRVHSTRLFQGLVFVLVAMTCGIATPAPPTAMLRAPESAPKYGGVLRWAGLADAPFFDLHQCDTAACATPMEPMYDTLLRYNPLDGGKTVVPDLAYQWETSSDGLTYTFHLRDGVTFHDGAPLTAAAVKASFDHIIFPPQASSVPGKPCSTPCRRSRRSTR